MVTVARWLPLMTMCPSAMDEGFSNARAAGGVVKGEALDAGENEATTIRYGYVAHEDGSR